MAETVKNKRRRAVMTGIPTETSSPELDDLEISVDAADYERLMRGEKLLREQLAAEQAVTKTLIDRVRVLEDKLRTRAHNVHTLRKEVDAAHGKILVGAARTECEEEMNDMQTKVINMQEQVSIKKMQKIRRLTNELDEHLRCPVCFHMRPDIVVYSQCGHTICSKCLPENQVCHYKCIQATYQATTAIKPMWTGLINTVNQIKYMTY